VFPNYVGFVNKVDGLEMYGSHCMWPILRDWLRINCQERNGIKKGNWR